jgi:predicted DNA-binding protein
MNTNNKVIKQFPVRLGSELHEHFDRVSNETHINKSILVRLAVEKLINEIDKSGLSEKIKNVYEV